MKFICLSSRIGIDLGTTSTLVYKERNGIVLRESSVVAIKDSPHKKVLFAGDEAKNMTGKTADDVSILEPLKNGVIADIGTASGMLKYFIDKMFSIALLRLEVIIGYPAGASQLEKMAVAETAYRAGANKVYLVPNPLTSAIGAGLPVEKTTGSIIVDIGGGITDIAIVSAGNIVLGKSLRIAGDDMDEAIVSYIRTRYKLLIGKKTAEHIKMEIGSAAPEEMERTVEIQGKDLLSGFPKLLIVKASEINKALKNPVISIINAVKSIIEMAPPEFSTDMLHNGIMLTGGGALLNGFDKLLRKETGLQVNIADKPLDCVASGTGKIIGELKNINPVNCKHRSQSFTLYHD